MLAPPIPNSSQIDQPVTSIFPSSSCQPAQWLWQELHLPAPRVTSSPAIGRIDFPTVSTPRYREVKPPHQLTLTPRFLQLTLLFAVSSKN